MSQEPRFFDPQEIVPSLRAAFGENVPDGTAVPPLAIPVPPPANAQDAQEGQEGTIEVPLPIPNRSMSDRNHIGVMVQEGEIGEWLAPQIGELFRGNKQPPSLLTPPPEYALTIHILEAQLLELIDIFGPLLDSELLEAYTALRRRPDGKSLGYVHDVLWQAAALMLGLKQVSQAEFEAILARLESSVRTWRQGPASRNYCRHLSQAMGDV